MGDLVAAVERLALSKNGSSSQAPVPEQTSGQESRNAEMPTSEGRRPERAD
jgi:hypothetical protein